MATTLAASKNPSRAHYPAASWAGQINTLIGDFAVERLDGETVLGDGTASIISQPEHVTGTGIVEFAISVICVVDRTLVRYAV